MSSVNSIRDANNLIGDAGTSGSIPKPDEERMVRENVPVQGTDCCFTCYGVTGSHYCVPKLGGDFDWENNPDMDPTAVVPVCGYEKSGTSTNYYAGCRYLKYSDTKKTYNTDGTGWGTLFAAKSCTDGQGIMADRAAGGYTYTPIDNTLNLPDDCNIVSYNVNNFCTNTRAVGTDTKPCTDQAICSTDTASICAIASGSCSGVQVPSNPTDPNSTPAEFCKTACADSACAICLPECETAGGSAICNTCAVGDPMICTSDCDPGFTCTTGSPICNDDSNAVCALDLDGLCPQSCVDVACVTGTTPICSDAACTTCKTEKACPATDDLICSSASCETCVPGCEIAGGSPFCNTCDVGDDPICSSASCETCLPGCTTAGGSPLCSSDANAVCALGLNGLCPQRCVGNNCPINENPICSGQACSTCLPTCTGNAVCDNDSATVCALDLDTLCPNQCVDIACVTGETPICSDAACETCIPGCEAAGGSPFCNTCDVDPICPTDTDALCSLASASCPGQLVQDPADPAQTTEFCALTCQGAACNSAEGPGTLICSSQCDSSVCPNGAPICDNDAPRVCSTAANICPGQTFSELGNQEFCSAACENVFCPTGDVICSDSVEQVCSTATNLCPGQSSATWGDQEFCAAACAGDACNICKDQQNCPNDNLICSSNVCSTAAGSCPGNPVDPNDPNSPEFCQAACENIFCPTSNVICDGDTQQVCSTAANLCPGQSFLPDPNDPSSSADFCQSIAGSSCNQDATFCQTSLNQCITNDTTNTFCATAGQEINENCSNTRCINPCGPNAQAVCSTNLDVNDPNSICAIAQTSCGSQSGFCDTASDMCPDQCPTCEAGDTPICTSQCPSIPLQVPKLDKGLCFKIWKREGESQDIWLQYYNPLDGTWTYTYPYAELSNTEPVVITKTDTNYSITGYSYVYPDPTQPGQLVESIDFTCPTNAPHSSCLEIRCLRGGKYVDCNTVLDVEVSICCDKVDNILAGLNCPCANAQGEKGTYTCSTDPVDCSKAAAECPTQDTVAFCNTAVSGCAAADTANYCSYALNTTTSCPEFCNSASATCDPTQWTCGTNGNYVCNTDLVDCVRAAIDCPTEVGGTAETFCRNSLATCALDTNKVATNNFCSYAPEELFNTCPVNFCSTAAGTDTVLGKCNDPLANTTAGEVNRFCHSSMFHCSSQDTQFCNYAPQTTQSACNDQLCTLAATTCPVSCDRAAAECPTPEPCPEPDPCPECPSLDCTSEGIVRCMLQAECIALGGTAPSSAIYDLQKVGLIERGKLVINTAAIPAGQRLEIQWQDRPSGFTAASQWMPRLEHKISTTLTKQYSDGITPFDAFLDENYSTARPTDAPKALIISGNNLSGVDTKGINLNSTSPGSVEIYCYHNYNKDFPTRSMAGGKPCEQVIKSICIK